MMVLLDCDDVLLDWIGGFRDWCSAKLGREIAGEPQSWDMSEWLGVSEEEAKALIAEHNAGPHFGELEAVSGAKEGVATWVATKQIRLHVITSCSSDAETVARRKTNLQVVFGDVFDSIHCLDLGQSKLQLLQSFRPGSLWVEDNFKNALLGVEAGHNVAMRERPHNLEFKKKDVPGNLKWFSDWSELAG